MDSSSQGDVTVTDWQSDFQRTLDREILRSEKIRVALLAGVFAFFFVVSLFLILVPGFIEEGLHAAFLDMAWPLLGVLLCGFFYELAMLWRIKHHLASGKRPSAVFAHVNVSYETLLPTFILLVMIHALGPVQALLAPPALFYFLLIFLVSLHLDPRLSIFAGLVAALQYLLLVFIYIEPDLSLPGYSLLTAPHQYFMRGIMLVVAGVVGGFVSSQIRKQMAASIRTLEERDRAISIFGQHVSPEVAQRLLSQPMDTGGEVRSVCVMFLDIRDFSEYAREHNPEDVMRYLNLLFGGMIDIVNRHQGIVNKFLGDGFMAVFGAPVDDSAQCDHAARAALEIVEEVGKLNASNDIPPTRVGMGLHVGEAVTGNVGSLERKEYTIIGDVVNLASRIEQATKKMGCQILISEAVGKILDEAQFPFDDLGMVELKGQDKPVRVLKLA